MDRRHLLPGIAIADRPSASPDALPRMDVAFFVGFASRGPVHRPVLIESTAAFAAVFGDDLPLVPGYRAALGPAVRAFFANGGTRCHVQRTCRTADLEADWRKIAPADDFGGIAQTGHYTLPGLTALAADGKLQPAVVRAASCGSWSDALLVCARVERTAIALRNPALTPEGLALPLSTSLQNGELVELHFPDGTRTHGEARRTAGALHIDLFEGAAIPGMPTRLDRLQLYLGTSTPGTFSSIGPFGLTPRAPDNWWAQRNDDEHYGNPDASAAQRSPLAPADAPLPRAWLPSHLTYDWSLLAPPEPSDATALERDGLSRFDAELFLDPRLADNRGAGLLTQAEFVRQHDGDILYGIHGALSLPGGADFAEPSLIAVPDLSQPGWKRTVTLPAAAFPADPFATPDNWRDHAGACLPPGTTPSAAPDDSRFLDCGTRALPAPAFLPLAPQPTGPLHLRWRASLPDATYVLYESARADMADAIEIWRGDDLEHIVHAAHPGAYYYGIRAERDGNVSRAGLAVAQITASDWTPCISPYNDAALITGQQALLRLCLALGDQFALLSLPLHYRSAQATMHRARLCAGLSFNEQASLRHAALYHPWPLGTGSASAQLVPVPPEGAAAGVIARRARDRGAWIAPARVPLADVLALAAPVPQTDREALAAAMVNIIAQDPQGFMMTDAMTLSDEKDWREINVRRLVSLLRRTAVRIGARFVFEPNGDVLRRALERTFGHLLDDLLRRGAFAGKGADESYRLTVDADDSDRASGRITIELAVAPARPLRFLTVVLRQTGERLSVIMER